MTIICAYRDQKSSRTILGCNSRALVGDTVIPGDRSKWDRYGRWMISFTGRGIMSDTINASRADFPVDSESIFEIVQHIRRLFRDAEIGKEDDGAIDFDTSGLIVSQWGAIYDVDCRLSVDEINPNTLWASGSGMEYALGAAHASAVYDLPPEDLVRAAVEAAIALDSGCPGSPVIEEF